MTRTAIPAIALTCLAVYGLSLPVYGSEQEETSDKARLIPEITLFDGAHGEDKTRLWSQTKLLFGMGVGVMGVLSLMPSVSKWDEEEDDGYGRYFKKWRENVSSGPVWDNDEWYINYVGHPYSGGIYYQVARNSGYDQFNSFTYSALMSTFYWEYGIEAFAEIPSIQDLIITPVGGWLYGEWAYQKSREIRRDGGKVWGSQTMGDITLALIDPVGALAKGINNTFGTEVVVTGFNWTTTAPGYMPEDMRRDDDYLGVSLQLRF